MGAPEPRIRLVTAWAMASPRPYPPCSRLRELSARLEGADPFLRTAFCLEVFRERQLLTLRQEGDTISITLTGQGKHVRLEESGYLQGLHEVMQPKRGGDHHD